MDDKFITIPRAIVPPYDLERYDYYAKGEERRKEYGAEKRLRDGSASLPERIQAAWDRYGKDWDSEDRGYMVRIPDYRPLMGAPYEPATANEPVKYDTFVFRREVTRNKDFTVTRIHCDGLTVYEKVS